MNNYFSNIISPKAVVEILQKSGLNDHESILLNSFLLVLRKEKIIPLFSTSKEEDKRSEIVTKISASKNEALKSYSYEFLQPLMGKMKVPYLNELIQAYSGMDDNFVRNHIREFFDDQLTIFLGYKGKQTSDVLQPKELTSLINHFLPKGEQLNYYNPFAGLASLALDLPNEVSYYGEELDRNTWILAKLRLIIYDAPELYQFANVNSIEQWHYSSDTKYDFIAFNPPFNVRLDESYIPFLRDEEFGNARNANSLIVSQSFKKLKQSGKMVFVMPGGFLSSTGEKELALKKFLINNNYIDLIIALPSRILNFTGIPIFLIVLDKNKSREEVRFINGSQLYNQENHRINRINLERIISILENEEDSNFSKKIKSPEIRLSNYNLAVTRYVYEEPEYFLEEDEELTPLSGLLIRIPRNNPTDKIGKVITIRDLVGDKLNPQLILQNIENKELKAAYNTITTKALLISTIGRGLQPAIIVPMEDEKVYINPNILAFSIDESKILPEYLILELYKGYIQKQLQQFRIGTQIPRIKLREFLSLKLVLPSLEIQKEQIAKERYELYQEKAIEVKELATTYNIDVADENSFLRHQIAGSLRNLRSSFKFLKSILEEKVKPDLPEVFNLKLKDQLPSNLGNYMERIERDLLSITSAVNQAGSEIELSDIQVERIDIIKFIQKYKEELQGNNGGRFTIEVDIDAPALAENNLKTVYIDGDKELLRKMIDNIIENADKHAFERKINPSNRIKFEFLYGFEDSNLQLDITNTGKPLPEDFSYEAFVRKGSSSGPNAGDGTGGWFIYEVMKKHNGKFGFTDETGPEGIDGDFVTSIELTFPIHIK